jgi:hypothetical protein
MTKLRGDHENCKRDLSTQQTISVMMNIAEFGVLNQFYAPTDIS